MKPKKGLRTTPSLIIHLSIPHLQGGGGGGGRGGVEFRTPATLPATWSFCTAKFRIFNTSRHHIMHNEGGLAADTPVKFGPASLLSFQFDRTAIFQVIFYFFK